MFIKTAITRPKLNPPKSHKRLRERIAKIFPYPRSCSGAAAAIELVALIIFIIYPSYNSSNKNASIQLSCFLIPLLVQISSKI